MVSRRYDRFKIEEVHKIEDSNVNINTVIRVSYNKKSIRYQHIAFQVHRSLSVRRRWRNSPSFHQSQIHTSTTLNISNEGDCENNNEILEPSDSDDTDSDSMIIIGGVRKNDGSLQDHLIPKINCVTLVGRVGQNPEPKYFDDGKVVLRLGLAVKRKYHPPERQARNIKYGEEETDWFNLELWGRDAEYAGKYVVKGARVGVTGSLNVDAWTDRMSGEERTSVKIVVKQLDILETRAEAQLRQNRRGSYNSNTYGTSNDNHASSGRRNSHSSSAETRQSINNQRNGIRSVFKREDLFSVANSNVYVDPEQSQSQSTDTSKAASANSAVIEEEGNKFNDSESKNPPRDGESSGFNDDKSDGETVTSSAQETSSPESNPRSMSLESSPNKDKNFNGGADKSKNEPEHNDKSDGETVTSSAQETSSPESNPLSMSLESSPNKDKNINGGADKSKNEPESTSIEHSNTMNTHGNQRRISRQ